MFVQGMRVRADGPQLISAMVTRMLGINCSVLMGANVRVGWGGGMQWRRHAGVQALENPALYGRTCGLSVCKDWRCSYTKITVWCD